MFIRDYIFVNIRKFDSTHPKSVKRRDLTWLLDNSIQLPGGLKIGLDGLIGLIPGVGDVVGGGLSTWILYQAYKQGVPKTVLARMVVNIFIDTVIGFIPLIGDLFDFIWKANAKNATLLARHKEDLITAKDKVD